MDQFSINISLLMSAIYVQIVQKKIHRYIYTHMYKRGANVAKCSQLLDLGEGCVAVSYTLKCPVYLKD